MLKRWQRCIDAAEGEDSIKTGPDSGREYLPQLTGQDLAEYSNYKKRATFFGATKRTVEGIAGAVFRKDPTLEWPDQSRDMLESIGVGKESIFVVAQRVFSSILAIGRVGLLVDIKPNAMINEPPQWAIYGAASIINWRCNEYGELVLVILKEEINEPKRDDPYEYEEVTQYRELFLSGNEVTASDGSIAREGTYVQRLWRKPAGSDHFVVVDTIVPVVRGKQLTEIPFVFFNARDAAPRITLPPILDVVNLNIAHYRNSADYEHGLHYTGIPTACVAGFNVTSEEKLKIGSETAWISEDPSAKAWFLEFTGAGLGSLKEAMQDKEAQMAVLGARLLEEPKRAVESADTHKIRRSGEDGVTSNIAKTVSKGMTRCLEITARWLGISQDVSIELNTDLLDVRLTAQEMTALLALLQAGTISYSTFFFNLQRSGAYREGWTELEERDAIETSPPASNGEVDDLDEPDDEDEDEDEDDEDEDDDLRAA